METRTGNTIGAARTVTVGGFTTETVGAAIVFIGGYGAASYQYSFEGTW